MNIFSKKFWHHFSKGWTQNPITDLFSNYAKESGLQTDAEDEYKKIKHTDPNTIEERTKQFQDHVNHSGDNTDTAEAGVDAAVGETVDAAADAALDGAILEERTQ